MPHAIIDYRSVDFFGVSKNSPGNVDLMTKVVGSPTSTVVASMLPLEGKISIHARACSISDDCCSSDISFHSLPILPDLIQKYIKVSRSYDGLIGYL